MKQSIILTVQIILWTVFLSFDASAQLGFQNPFFVAAELKSAAGGCATPNAPSSVVVNDSADPPNHEVDWTDPSGSFDGLELWVSTDGAGYALGVGGIAPASDGPGFGKAEYGQQADGHVYIYKVRATNACGTQSAFSNTVTNDIFVDVVYYNAFEQAAGSSKTATVDTAGFGSLTEQGGTVTSTTGIKNNASAFTSVAGHYLKSASASGNTLFASDFTVSIWVYVTSLPSSSVQILIRQAAPDCNLYLDSGGVLNWGPDNDQFTTASLGALNAWHLIVIELTANSNISVDGSTLTLDGAPSPPSGDDFLYIANTISGSSAAFRVDEVSIFPRALSQAEITSLYGGGTNPRFR